MNDINPQADATQDTSTQEAQAPSVTDLDGLSEFQFQGNKYTPEQLLSIVNEHKNLSETAKQRQEREELDAHFEADRVRLLKDPSLADLFRQKYPQRYHWILDFLPQGQRPQPAQPNAAPNALPPELAETIRDLKERVSFYDNQALEASVVKANAQLDQITKPLFEKFNLADEDAVFAKADALLQQKVKLTDKVWERIVRESHEKIQKRYDQHQGSIIKQQVEKGRRAADVGPGGATPGQAPQRARSFAEAQAALLKHVEAGGS